MPRSIMDWFGVVTLWLGATVFAIKSGNFSLPAGAPSWLASPLWTLVPAVLITLSAIAFVIRGAIRPRAGTLAASAATTRQVERPHRESSDWAIVALVAVPMLGTVAMFGFNAWKERPAELAVASNPTAQPPVLRGYVTQAFIKQTLAERDPVTAETMLAQYLHTPMHAAGSVFEKRGQQGYRLYVVDLTPKGARPRVYLVFDGRKNDLSSYRSGDHVSAWCKIERLDETGIGLTGCTLVEPAK